MRQLPTGTVTLLFADIEGSTHLLHRLGERYPDVLAECRDLLQVAFQQHHGYEVDTQGDAFFIAFARATDAIWAAVTAQRALASYSWPEGVTVRVRMGVHTGEPQLSSEGYVGLDVHHTARIMNAGHGGQVLLSQTTRDLVEQVLPEDVHLCDLGAHRLKDLQSSTHFFQLVITGLPAHFPPLQTLDASPNNLPVQPTPFIGREREMAAVIALLGREDVRLLTLTGPGGIGKTRLLLQIAAEVSDQFVDGVFFVALAPVSDTEQVVPTIMQTLSIKEVGGQPLLRQLKAVLKDKQMLLLLDNFEQVVEAAMVVAELLVVCPKLKIIITSRMVLHVQAEREFAIPPLSLPNLKRLPDLVTLSQYEAVALFIQRAQAVKPDFAVTNANAPAVAGICARLDGLPLAIELAAAHIKFFAPQALLSRLEQGLAMLTGGARDLPARQQTLRGAIAWSYNLLSLEEQQLFRRVSVVVDGCMWEAADVVCRAAGELKGDVLDGLLSLVDKCLLRQEESEQGEPRFSMLQTLREFGLEILAITGETELTRQAHAEYYLKMAEEAKPHLQGSEQVRWLARMEREHENLRAALSFLLDRIHVQAGTLEGQQQASRLCVALSWFWITRGYLREGKAFLDQALVGRSDVEAALRARTLYAAAELAFALEREEMFCVESLTLYRELGDTVGIANCLRLLGSTARTRGKYTLGRSQLEEAAALFSEVGDRWKQGQCFTELARIATEQGQYERAHTLLEESLLLYQALGDQVRLGWVRYLLARMLFVSQQDLERAQILAEQSLAISQELGAILFSALPLGLLGEIHLTEGKYTQAHARLEESIRLSHEAGNRGDSAESLIGLARVAVAQANLAAAHRHYQECLTMLHEVDYQVFIPACLEGLAAVVAAQGEPLKAARLSGTAEALREAMGAPIYPVYRTGYEQVVATARVQLGEKAFTAAWAEGRAMTPEHTLAITGQVALPEGAKRASHATPSSRIVPPTPTYPDGLTAREVEVLRLVAQGLTNAQIAEHLIISPTTVNAHMRSLYSKVAVNTRIALMRYATEHHLT
jgi:predicted ATPase/class 3 adenylate cyclase/DNA-binding CsgD family transcriptional regulator